MPRKKQFRSSLFRSKNTRSRFAKPVEMPNIGGMVKREIYDLEISIPALAKRMNVSPDRAYRLLKRNDWRVSEIMTLSTIIAYNLFEWYAEQTQPSEPVASVPETTVSTDAELQLLLQKNAILEAENKLLPEMVEVMKAK